MRLMVLGWALYTGHWWVAAAMIVSLILCPAHREKS